MSQPMNNPKHVIDQKNVNGLTRIKVYNNHVI